MQAALNNGTYRFNRPCLNCPTPTDPAVMAAISPTLEQRADQLGHVRSTSGRRASLMNLDGGPLGLSLGAEYALGESRTPRACRARRPPRSSAWAFRQFDMSATCQAMYGEVIAPVTKWLELSAALRYDHYSDFGSSTVPKFGFKVRPHEPVLLRGTYSEAFRAPGPAEIGGSSFGFTTFGILSQGNPNIKPETAKSYYVGRRSASRGPAPA